MVTAGFEFTDNHQLKNFNSAGSAVVNAAANQQMDSFVLNRPGLTTVQMAERLREVNAQFGPERGAEMRKVAQATISRLTPVLGKARVDAIEWAQGDGPTWEVGMIATQGARRTHYLALFEVFGGKLVALSMLES